MVGGCNFTKVIFVWNYSFVSYFSSVLYTCSSSITFFYPLMAFTNEEGVGFPSTFAFMQLTGGCVFSILLPCCELVPPPSIHLGMPIRERCLCFQQLESVETLSHSWDERIGKESTAALRNTKYSICGPWHVKTQFLYQGWGWRTFRTKFPSCSSINGKWKIMRRH